MNGMSKECVLIKIMWISRYHLLTNDKFHYSTEVINKNIIYIQFIKGYENKKTHK